MMSPNRDKASAGSLSEAAREMDRYGITCVPVAYFHFGQYRYTHLKDAVAEAERQRHKG